MFIPLRFFRTTKRTSQGLHLVTSCMLGMSPEPRGPQPPEISAECRVCDLRSLSKGICAPQTHPTILDQGVGLNSEVCENPNSQPPCSTARDSVGGPGTCILMRLWEGPHPTLLGFLCSCGPLWGQVLLALQPSSVVLREGEKFFSCGIFFFNNSSIEI